MTTMKRETLGIVIAIALAAGLTTLIAIRPFSAAHEKATAIKPGAVKVNHLGSRMLWCHVTEGDEKSGTIIGADSSQCDVIFDNHWSKIPSCDVIDNNGNKLRHGEDDSHLVIDGVKPGAKITYTCK